MIRVVQLCGGVGNQLFQYARAVGSGDTLWFDRVHFSAARLRRPRLLDLGLPLRVLPERVAAGLRRCWWYGARTSHGGWSPRMVHAAGMPAEEVDLEWRLPGVRVQVGYWQRPQVPGAAVAALRDRLGRLPLAAASAGFAAWMQGRDAIAVHVRLGDYRQPAVAATFGLLDAAWYRRALEALDPHGQRAIALFSDEPEAAGALFDVRRAVRVAPPGDELEHLALLARARALVIANRSFSWWGARLAPAPPAMVVAPLRWHRHPQAWMHDPVPVDWRRV